jgi:hypothetical protein
VRTLLDTALESAQALEGDADGVLDAAGIEALDDVLAEEGAVHAQLDASPG